MTTLAELTTMIHENARQHGWWDNDRGLPETLMLVVSELAEALEEYRTHHEPNEIYYNNDKPEGIPVELADAVIRILDARGQYGIDMETVILAKHQYNLTRDYKHGKRV